MDTVSLRSVALDPSFELDLPLIFPARFDTGPSVVVGAVSTVGGAHPVGTRSAVDGVAGASDDRPVAEGVEPHPGASVDPDDTSRCPRALWCESCRSTGPGLDVESVQTPVGIYCLTLCQHCYDHGYLPAAGSWASAVHAVLSHAEHLGVDTDTIATAVASKDAEPVAVAPVHCLSCPRCTSSNVADLGGYAECRECGYGFSL